LASEKGQTELALAIYNGFAKVAQLSSPKENLANENSQPNRNNVVSDAKSSKVVYKVQFLSSSKELKKTDPTFKNISNMEMEKVGKVFKYTTGNCSTHEEAKEVLTSVKKAGFSDAFVVVYKKDGTRITLQEAKEIENNK
jgi:N-acetylmuramoyl-L-alanine amidase